MFKKELKINNIQTQINTLNSNLSGLNEGMEIKGKNGLGCLFFYNNAIAIIYFMATGIHQESGALSSFIALPEGVTPANDSIYITTSMLNSYWRPNGMSAYIKFTTGVRNATVWFTNDQDAVSEVIVGTHVFPRWYFNIEE